MRVLNLLVVLGLVACGGTNEGGLHASSQKSSKGSSSDKSSSSKKSDTSTPTQSPTTPDDGVDDSPASPVPSTSSTNTTPAPPSTPPAAGSCGAPKCVAGFGSCGCKATDANGQVVTMGCQDGQCACFNGFNQSTDAFDADCADAQGAFFANCQCD